MPGLISRIPAIIEVVERPPVADLRDGAVAQQRRKRRMDVAMATAGIRW